MNTLVWQQGCTSWCDGLTLWTLLMFFPISLQLWCLDNDTFAGTGSALAELLKISCTHGISNDRTLNL